MVVVVVERKTNRILVDSASSSSSDGDGDVEAFRDWKEKEGGLVQLLHSGTRAAAREDAGADPT